MQRDRWKRAIDHTNGGLGELAGRRYVEKHFPAESKTKMQELVANLRAALRDRLGQLAWLSEPTRKRAIEKLDTFAAKIGYPDKWEDYTALEARHGDLIGNVRRAQLWDWHRDVARLMSRSIATSEHSDCRTVFGVGERRFFLSWAQVCAPSIATKLRMGALGFAQPPYFRVNGAVRNLEE